MCWLACVCMVFCFGVDGLGVEGFENAASVDSIRALLDGLNGPSLKISPRPNRARQGHEPFVSNEPGAVDVGNTVGIPFGGVRRRGLDCCYVASFVARYCANLALHRLGYGLCGSGGVKGGSGGNQGGALGEVFAYGLPDKGGLAVGVDVFRQIRTKPQAIKAAIVRDLGDDANQELEVGSSLRGGVFYAVRGFGWGGYCWFCGLHFLR